MARVHHFVPSARTTWGYFWRRCFFVNKGKVEAFRQMGGASNLSADIGFVGHALSRGVWGGLREAVRGDVWGAVRAMVILVGIVLAGAGHLAGQAQWRVGRMARRPSRREGRPVPRPARSGPVAARPGSLGPVGTPLQESGAGTRLRRGE
jgi:glucosyl-dolichyl phosphate glucuronosyltransferase